MCMKKVVALPPACTLLVIPINATSKGYDNPYQVHTVEQPVDLQMELQRRRQPVIKTLTN